MQPISEVMELFRHQRAVRAWSDKPVPDDLVRQVIEAATHAPSGSNSQPWRFLVIRDQAVKEQVSALYEEAMAEQYQGAEPDRARDRQTLAEAPVIIVPCVRVPRNGRVGFQTGASVYPACQNLMLAARALGLGTVLSTLHRLRREQIHDLPGITERWDSAAMIPLGWPDRPYGPNHRRPVEEFIVYDHFAE
jgi:nitroreductase